MTPPRSRRRDPRKAADDIVFSRRVELAEATAHFTAGKFHKCRRCGTKEPSSGYWKYLVLFPRYVWLTTSCMRAAAHAGSLAVCLYARVDFLSILKNLPYVINVGGWERKGWRGERGGVRGRGRGREGKGEENYGDLIISK